MAEYTPDASEIGSTITLTYSCQNDPTNNCSAPTDDMLLEVLDSVIPTFTQLGPYCEDESADNLPDVSNNGISGTWSPSFISTNFPGVATHTFTPDAGSCGAEVMMDIEVFNLAEAELTSTDTDLCPGECITVTFDVSEGEGGPYDLEFEISAAGLSFPFVIPLSTTSGNFMVCSTTSIFPSFSGNTLFIPELFLSLIHI